MIKVVTGYGLTATPTGSLGPMVWASHAPAIVLGQGPVEAAQYRVEKAVVAGYANPDVRIFLDTFMDHDRGYFPRAGLYDRRLNPRRAAFVLRHLNSAINIHGTDITIPIKQDINGWTIITFDSSQTSYCLHLPNTTDPPALQIEPTTST